MTTVTPQFSLALNEEERTLLLSMLEQMLRDTRVEVHRTEAPDYREWVERRETVLQDVINRLRAPAPAARTGEREER